MNRKHHYLSIKEIGEKEYTKQGKVYEKKCLHYIHPSSGGWGVVRAGLLVPESIVLFILPQGCGRHGSIAGYIHDFNKRLFILAIKDYELIDGSYTEKIEEAVETIFNRLDYKPKVLLLGTSCVDDILGNDYEYLIDLLEDKYKIKARRISMNPIRTDTSESPTLAIHKVMANCLECTEYKDGGVNIWGSFAGIIRECEIYNVLKEAGIDNIRHISDYNSFEKFQDMSKSSFNLLIKPEGKLAVKNMKNEFGTPFIMENVSYGLETINKGYKNIEKFLGVQLKTTKYKKMAEEAVKRYRENLGRLSLAIGDTCNASPFELAHALVSYGFEVPYIFADDIISSDWEHIDWLKENNEDLKVFTNIHPSMSNYNALELQVDVAIGLDAGYFCKGSKTVPLTLDVQPYGYMGVIYLFDEIAKAIGSQDNHREMLYKAGMIV